MKTKVIIIILLAGCLSGGGYYYYQYNYVNTLMLSEIVGHSNDPIINILVNLGDFDTGLTRHDIQQLESNKDYWLNRIKEIESIDDPVLKEQANTKLLSDMMEDPVMKKVCKIITYKGFSFAISLLEGITS